jgi:hypothetical protein
MTSLERSDSVDSQQTEVINEIIVICSDGARITVDLNIFPSATLRNLAQSNFADCKTTRIMFDSYAFLSIYKRYLPNITDFLDLPQEITLLDVAISPKIRKDFNGDMRFKATGHILCTFQQQKFCFDIVDDEKNMHEYDWLCDAPVIDIETCVCTSRRIIVVLHGKFNNRIIDDIADEKDAPLAICREFKRSIRATITGSDNGSVCTNEMFLEWFKCELLKNST